MFYFQAEKLGTKQLDEESLFDLIKTLPGKKGSKSSTKTSAKKSKSPADTVKSKENSFEDFDDDFDIEMAEVVDCVSSSNSKVESDSAMEAQQKKSDEVFEKPEVCFKLLTAVFYTGFFHIKPQRLRLAIL